MSTITDEMWREDALCAEVDPALFFPDRGQPAAPARAICEQCPVLTQCLEYALARPKLEGVWGAKTSHERKALRGWRVAHPDAPAPAVLRPVQSAGPVTCSCGLSYCSGQVGCSSTRSKHMRRVARLAQAVAA